MTSHKQTALDCAVRIANTLLIQEKIEAEGLTAKILASAEKFESWLGPEPVKSFGNKPAKKIAEGVKCPVCQGDMYDLRESKKNPKAPDMRCTKATWDATEGRYTGCNGVKWPADS